MSKRSLVLLVGFGTIVILCVGFIAGSLWMWQKQTKLAAEAQLATGVATLMRLSVNDVEGAKRFMNEVLDGTLLVLSEYPDHREQTVHLAERLADLRKSAEYLPEDARIQGALRDFYDGIRERRDVPTNNDASR
ncbi:hypothetical protein J5J83_22835 [Azoarcus sp. L1K30]|uniref:hypothetical protein n=1 Tax=Azoarcus sp. L1K30 TaxID=2820277 RepID=UPI001B8423B8|nr:hypothetical protein [Azoarcus sp. L1K30]MBR0568973.1 hypothetical protein [Azoarcus sp. L1K30]